MRTALAIFVLALLLLPLYAQTDDIPYRIEFDPEKDVTKSNDSKGLFITVRFNLTVNEAQAAKVDASAFKIVIEEDGKRVREENVPAIKPPEDLAVMLALDTSGSMKEGTRMEQARLAAGTFLAKLPGKAECGLILFDHEIRQPTLKPTADRPPLVNVIQAVKPRGGTAYLDAAERGIEILKGDRRDKALVIMTDGIDLNSKATPKAIIEQARKSKVRIYTVGIGEAGKLEPVTSVLVLDHSGSMKPPADDKDTTPKIQALHRAASRFVDIMPATGRTTLIPFSTVAGVATPFSGDKYRLKQGIGKLAPHGETALFDAVHSAIGTLEAENPPGKRVVVAMTDGIDNTSRRRVEEVIDAAREAKVPLYLLGFGRPGELDAKTMQRMARETGGQYYHAGNEKDLLEIFENLSIKIHDDGIDEVTLGKLAGETGGKYFHARNVNELKFILESVTQNIQRKSYEITFPSQRQIADATRRQISLKLIRLGKDVQKLDSGVDTSGIVIAEMSHLVYLAFLAGLGCLLALPAVLRRSSADSN